VDDLNVIKAAVTDAEVYMPERTTFYGSREIGVKDPTGHFIIFAHFAAPGSCLIWPVWRDFADCSLR
jgi:hypothetical protein